MEPEVKQLSKEAQKIYELAEKLASFNDDQVFYFDEITSVKALEGLLYSELVLALDDLERAGKISKVEEQVYKIEPVGQTVTAVPA